MVEWEEACPTRLDGLEKGRGAGFRDDGALAG
jgi:hypothetical protein